MRKFNNDRDFDRQNDRSGGRRSQRPTLFEAVCDECGKDCKVPFMPSSDKPIYCSDCFEKLGNPSPRRDRDSKDSRGSRDFNDSAMFPAVCDDCGRDCQVPFRPTGDKPIYCSRCFEKRGNSHETTNQSFRSQDPKPQASKDLSYDIIKKLSVLEEINTKLTKIITLLEVKDIIKKYKDDVKVTPVKAEENKVVKEEKKVKKTKKKEIVEEKVNESKKKPVKEKRSKE